ncbi:NAD(P)-dependent alcohol dehydrogenase [Kordia algicida OT-1]|uniref:Alcohol dehydrogenase, zinc containing n=1 Tax=Kordia algicida OT-1 TaxID=391587 RepID=A9EA92_9FLAO|nr:NAD(P)-dependent alcohol dehydrogenase [Kordia algicida]EDP94602.1 alcohol dehydrogenase, zinc containing [Kordia algicida OT-1]
MKAVIITKYGPPEVLEIRDIEKPQPKANEVLIKVHTTTAHAGDSRVRRSSPWIVVRLLFGFFKPKKNLIPGVELSGTIESVGPNATLFKKGDEVYGLTGLRLGSYAEYCCIPEKVKDGKQETRGIIKKTPSNLTLAECAVVPSAALTALKNLQKGKVTKGTSILINGASGSLGTYAIQLAKYYGAAVTAVCSGKNAELVKSIGADYVIDYTKEDFIKAGKKYDVVYDAVMKSTRFKCKKILKPKGIYLNNYWLPNIKEADMEIIHELIEKNELKPIIDRTYDMEDVVEAHKYLDTERKKGNVIIQIEK